MSDKWIVSYTTFDPFTKVTRKYVSTIDMHPARFFSNAESHAIVSISSVIRVPDELDLPNIDAMHVDRLSTLNA